MKCDKILNEECNSESTRQTVVRGAGLYFPGMTEAQRIAVATNIKTYFWCEDCYIKYLKLGQGD